MGKRASAAKVIPGFKACVFDIETSSLAAIGSGVLLCAVIKPLGGAPSAEVVLRGDKFGNAWGKEVKLVQAVMDELSRYRLLIGHNVEGFDVPWLRSRAKFFNIPDFGRPFVYDTMKGFRRLGYKTVPNHFGKPSKSLGHVIDFFGFEQEKTGIFPRRQWEIIWGRESERRAALDDLVNHCRADVGMTEKIFYAMIDDDHKASLRRV